LVLDGLWQHGWLVPEKNVHPELVIGFDGESRLFRKSRKFYVAREDQRVFLRQCGYVSVEAIGHPIIYVARPGVRRIRDSLLIMPVHSMVESVTIRDGAFQSYLEYIRSIRHYFAKVSACVHGNDLDYYGDAFRGLGIDVVEGSLMADQNSYTKMALLGCAYDYMTTYKFGSHVAYFSYYGCRVSVAGPAPGLDYEKFKDLNIYKNCPECLPLSLSINQSLGALYPAFKVEPWRAVANIGWAQEQLGEACKKPPVFFRHKLTRNRHLLYKVKQLFGTSFLSHVISASVSLVNAFRSRLFEGKQDLDSLLTQSFQVPGVLTCFELETLHRYAKTLRGNSIGAEIGSHLGATALATVSGCVGKPFKLYCLDAATNNKPQKADGGDRLYDESIQEQHVCDQPWHNVIFLDQYLEIINMDGGKGLPELLPANIRLSWLFMEVDRCIAMASWDWCFCLSILEPDALLILHCTGWPEGARKMVAESIINHCILEESLPNLKVFRYVGSPDWV
jgi:hypothetical protein